MITMVSPNNKFYYFISTYPKDSKSFKDNWQSQIVPTKEVTIPDRLYQTISCSQIKGKENFILYVGRIEKNLKKKKTYKTASISPTITFYFDQQYGFIETEEDQFDTAVHIFNKLLTSTPGKPIILFV